MTVRAKFTCNTMTIYGANAGCEFKFTPVFSTDKSSENFKFWTASPNGELRLYITNTEAFDRFEPGKEYFLDFTPAESK